MKFLISILLASAGFLALSQAQAQPAIGLNQPFINLKLDKSSETYHFDYPGLSGSGICGFKLQVVGMGPLTTDQKVGLASRITVLDDDKEIFPNLIEGKLVWLLNLKFGARYITDLTVSTVGGESLKSVVVNVLGGNNPNGVHGVNAADVGLARVDCNPEG